MQIGPTIVTSLRAARLDWKASSFWQQRLPRRSGNAFTRYLAILVLAAAQMAGAALTESATAHDWYEKECCDEGDCQPAPPGSVEYTDRGWLVRKGIRNPKGVILQFNIIVPFDHKKVRPRPKEAGPGIDICTSSDTVFCLYLDSGS